MKAISNVLSVILVIMVLASLLVAAELGDLTATGKEPVNKTPKVIIDELNVIGNSSKIDDFSHLGRDIESISISQNVNRRTKLELWLDAIDKLDRIIDPSFNPNDKPGWNNDFQFPVDDKVRQKRELAIITGEKKANYYNLQFEGRILIQLWVLRTKEYIRTHYASDKHDVDEVNLLIENHLSNKDRREQLKTLPKTQ
jgi:hypothetical protein